MSTKNKVGRPKKYNGKSKVYSHRVPETKYNEVKDIVDKIILKIINNNYSVDKKGFVDKDTTNRIIKTLSEGLIEFNKIMRFNKDILRFSEDINKEKLLEAIKLCKTI